MITDPSSGRVLGMEEMIAPENNAVKLTTLSKVLPHYPRSTPQSTTARSAMRMLSERAAANVNFAHYPPPDPVDAGTEWRTHCRGIIRMPAREHGGPL